MTIYLSPSRIVTFQDCPRAHWYGKHYRSLHVSWTLPYGSALHDAGNHMLIGLELGYDVDAMAAFKKRFPKSIEPTVSWTDGFNWEKAVAAAELALEELKRKWIECGWRVYRHFGQLMLELKHKLYLPSIDVMLVGVVDMVFIRDGKIVIADLKAPRSVSPGWFAGVSPQLQIYTMLMENLIGKRVDELAFLELPKRKTKCSAEFNSAPRPSNAELNELITEIGWIADDIRRNRFRRSVRMAHNTPCKLCDFQALCHNQSEAGLERREKKSKAA